jgi:hypothetical protein
MLVLTRSRPWAILVCVQVSLKYSTMLHIVTYSKLVSYCAMSKVLSHQPLTEEDRLPSQSSQRRFCDGQKGNWDIPFSHYFDFLLSASFF